MSYAVSGLVRSFTAGRGYPSHPLIPHGISVAVHAPAVFQFTGAAAPERHLQAAKLLGATNTERVQPEDSGKVLADTIQKFFYNLGVPNGLTALGYSDSDIPALVDGTLPQHRVTKLSPRLVGSDDLANIFKGAMTLY